MTTPTLPTNTDAPIDPYDQKSIYYIHHQELPNQNLISFKFDGRNYHAWERNMSRALEWKQKLGFAKGEVPRPVNNPDLLKHWTRCNNAVLTWILNSIDDKLVQGFSNCKSPTTLWEQIRKRFTQTSWVEIYRLEKKVMDLDQGSKDVVSYYNELMEAYDDLETLATLELCDCDDAKTQRNNNILEGKKVVKFLMGLNDTYKNLRSTILSTKPLPDLDSVYSLIHDEEHNLSVNSMSLESPHSSALFAGVRNRGGFSSGHRGGHRGGQQPDRKSVV